MDFGIAAQNLRLEAALDGVRRGHIEVMVVAYSRDGKPLNLTKARYGVALPPRAYEDALQEGLQVHSELDVPEGEAYLRTGVYDLNAHNAGTLGVPLAVAANQMFRTCCMWSILAHLDGLVL